MKPLIQRLRRAMLLQDGAGMTDAQLLECFIQRNDEAAFEALMRFHGPMVFGVCERILLNHHDAEEAFQATFLVLARKAGSISTRHTVANWLYGAAHRTALNARRARTRRLVKETQVAANSEAVDRRQHDQWSDVAPLLDQELSRLPDKYRTPVVLCDLEGKSHKEAARQLGCAEGTLSSRLARARILLANRLTRRGLVLSAGSMAMLLSENGASASVSSLLTDSIVEAARMSAVSQAAATGVISSNVAALTEGTVNSMFLSTLRNAEAAAVFALLVALSLGAGGLICQMRAAEQPGPLQVTGASNSKDAAIPKLFTDEGAIQGTWRVLTVEVVCPDSKLQDVLPETHGAVQILPSFTADKLTSSSESGLQKMREEHRVYAKQQRRTALKLFRAWTWADEEIGYALDTTNLPKRMNLKAAGAEEPERMRAAIYRLNGDDLQMFLGSEEETEPPADFDIRKAKPGSIVMTLSRDRDTVENAQAQSEASNGAKILDESEAIAKLELLVGKIQRDDKLPGHPVTRIDFVSGNRFRDKYCHLLKSFKHLTKLNLGGTEVTNGIFKEIGQNQNLTTLGLIATPHITGEGLKDLSQLKNLKTFSSYRNDISGIALKELGELKSLRELHLPESEITDTKLKEVGQLKELTLLVLSFNKITDAGLKELRGLENLRRLDLGHTEITDLGLAEFGGLKNLVIAGLNGTQITDAGLSSLRDLTNLATLDVVDTQVTDAGVKMLTESLPNLKITRSAGRVAHLIDAKMDALPRET